MDEGMDVQVIMTESGCESYADVAGLRTAFYQFFALAYRYPTAEVVTALQSRGRSLALLDMLGELYSVMPGTSETIALLKDAIQACDGSDDLRVEYARLFVGPFHLPAPPYESIYRDGSGHLLMGETTLDVNRSYREEGLGLSDSICDLPDHIIIEMEFMGHLCETESSHRVVDAREADSCLGKQDRFLSEHLAKWIPQFTHAVCSSTRMEVYRLLANLTNDFINLDRDYVRMLIKADEQGGRS